MITVRLTIEDGSTTEAFEAEHPDNTVAALAKVTTAAWAVHRREMLAAWETLKDAARMLGMAVPSTPLGEVKAHGAEACTDADCPWHRRA